MGTNEYGRNLALVKLCAENLRTRGFYAEVVEHEDQVAAAVEKLIPKDDLVGWGGSATLARAGVLDMVRKNFKCLDRDAVGVKGTDKEKEMRRQALISDTFLMSSNAISLDGQLVNIDGAGNRVAALCYGPGQVIVVAGANKIMKTLDSAIERARFVAAPMNMQRFPKKDCPCKFTGTCHDCKSPDTICCQFVVTRMCNPKERIKVLLVPEDMGF